MEYILFYDCKLIKCESSFNGEISWDMPNYKYDVMFEDAQISIKISGWDVSNVTNI